MRSTAERVSCIRLCRLPRSCQSPLSSRCCNYGSCAMSPPRLSRLREVKRQRQDSPGLSASSPAPWGESSLGASVTQSCSPSPPHLLPARARAPGRRQGLPRGCWGGEAAGGLLTGAGLSPRNKSHHFRGGTQRGPSAARSHFQDPGSLQLVTGSCPSPEHPSLDRGPATPQLLSTRAHSAPTLPRTRQLLPVTTDGLAHRTASLSEPGPWRERRRCTERASSIHSLVSVLWLTSWLALWRAGPKAASCPQLAWLLCIPGHHPTAHPPRPP